MQDLWPLFLVERILQRSLRAKRRWLFLVQPGVDRATDCIKERATASQQRITSCLPTSSMQTPSTRNPKTKNQKYYDATQQTDLKDYSFTTMILPIIAE